MSPYWCVFDCFSFTGCFSPMRPSGSRCFVHIMGRGAEGQPSVGVHTSRAPTLCVSRTQLRELQRGAAPLAECGGSLEIATMFLLGLTSPHQTRLSVFQCTPTVRE